MWSSVFHSGDGSITPEYDVSSINLSESALWIGCERGMTIVVVVVDVIRSRIRCRCRCRCWWHQRWRSNSLGVASLNRNGGGGEEFSRMLAPFQGLVDCTRKKYVLQHKFKANKVFIIKITLSGK